MPLFGIFNLTKNCEQKPIIATYGTYTHIKIMNLYCELIYDNICRHIGEFQNCDTFIQTTLHHYH